jgi:hypothetical protein
VATADERGGDPVAVGQGPQRQHPVEVGAGDGQAAGCRTGGQQQRVVIDALTVTQFDLPGGAVHRGYPDSGAQVHIVRGVPAGLVHEHRLTLSRAQ